MMIPPAARLGRSVLDVVAHSTRLWTQLLVAPWTVLTPPAVPAAPRAPTASNLAELITVAATDGPVTDHALLVLLGQFAQHLGLVDLLEAIPIAQKTVDHRPQTKLIQFLIGILAGLDYLQDFNDAPDPLVRDTAVQQAWQQHAFAHYSGVSRTLAAADAATLHALVAALQQVSRPFVEQEVLAIVRTAQALHVDIDLTGRVVSPTSTSYPDAAFGWMDDALAKGYQAAISSLSGGPTGRLLLSSQRYDGRAKSADCLRAAIQAVEQALGCRPRRRTTLVQAQVTTCQAALATAEQDLAMVREQIGARQWERDMLLQGVRPVASHARKSTRLEHQLARLNGRAARLAQRIERMEEQLAALQLWLVQLEADNAALPGAVEVVIRLDAGFATDANLAYLIELGYSVLTKVHSGHTTTRLQRAIPSDATWTQVGANAEAVPLGPQRVGDGRYALEALQVRYYLPTEQRHTTLLYYGDEPVAPPAEWFGQYNGRQVVEAGIKENKGVFTMRRPLVRSPIGMQIQEQCALFAANFVRWAAAWARECLHEMPPALAQALREVKTLVRVVAHSRARLVENSAGCALVFDTHSPFAGAVLVVRGQAIYQNVLPLFTVGATTPREVI